MRPAIPMLAALALAACSTSNVDNTVQLNPNISTLGWATFSWIGEKPMIAYEGSAVRRNPILEQQLENEIRAELESRGYRFVPEGGDFVVGYTVGIREGLDVREEPVSMAVYGGYGSYYAPYRGYRVGWAYDPFATRTSVSQYEEGTLAVDVYDADTRKPAWTSRSARRLSSQTARHPEAAISEVVDVTFAKFPARTGLVVAE